MKSEATDRAKDEALGRLDGVDYRLMAAAILPYIIKAERDSDVALNGPTRAMVAQSLMDEIERNPEKGAYFGRIMQSLEIYRAGHPLLDEVMAALKGRDEG